MNSSIDNNRSLVIYGAGDLRVETTKTKYPLSNDEVLVKIHSVGICGSDLQLYDLGVHKSKVVTKPLVIGHEASGTVVALGDDVTELQIGDRVAIEPNIPCLKCQFCRDGRYNLCPVSDRESSGFPDRPGCCRKYHNHPAAFCHLLPNNVSFEEGAMAEPLSIAVHACNRVSITPGQFVLISGAGPMGLLTALAAKAFGARKVFITDVSESRANYANKIGVDQAFFINASNFNVMEWTAKIALAFGRKPDVVIDCSGAQGSLQLALHVVKPGGKIGLVGIASGPVSVPLMYAVPNEIELIGISRMRDEFPTALGFLADKKINLKPLVTHRFSLENSDDAFRTLKNPNSGAIKVLIRVDEASEVNTYGKVDDTGKSVTNQPVLTTFTITNDQLV